MINEPPNRIRDGASYRAYLIGETGRIQHAVEIMAERDDDAAAQEEGLACVQPIEVWDRDRMVIQLSPSMRGRAVE